MSDITQEVANLIKSELEPKTFSTGSKGFFAQGKVTVAPDRYQVQAQAVLIGSKNDPRARVKGSAEEMAAELGLLLGDGFEARTFSSGKSGFRAQGKADVQGQRFQASVQAVRLA